MNITTRTQLCGLLGYPVDHSLSPDIHNAAFQHLGLDFVYLAFPVQDLEGAVRGIRALGNLRGFSITIPHKVAILRYVDEVEFTAQQIGSINTLVKDQGKLLGYNTDATGALEALRQAGVPVEGQSVVILGSGGAARAVAFALAIDGKASRVAILGIDAEERRALGADLREKTSCVITDGELTETSLRRTLKDHEVLIHCTPIGMHPKVQESCVPKELLDPKITVMDIVYNPLETRLLREARERGCRIVHGVEMFLNQAIGQFERWTGQRAPTEIMRTVIASRFR